MKTKANKLLSFVLALVMVFTSFISMPKVALAEESETAVVVASWTAPSNGSAIETPVVSETGNGTLAFSGSQEITVASNGYTVAGPMEGEYWTVSVDATNYKNLVFNAKLRSSGTGPAHFQLQYLDAEGNWNNIGEVQNVNKSLNKVFDKVELPEVLNNTVVNLRLLVADNVSVNGAELATGGNTNINNISIKGVSTEEEKPVVTVVEKPVASPEAGEVAKGTLVTLTSATEGASIYYNVGGDGYVEYKEPITVNEAVVIKAYAQKEGVKSEEAVFEYTVAASKNAQKLTRELFNGDEIVIVYAKGASALTATANGKKLNGTDALTITGDMIDLAASNAEILTVEAVGDGKYQFKNTSGKYLTSGATGSSLSFEETAGDYALWTTAPSTDGSGFYLVNANAKYGSSAQYLEYYNGFTTYSYKTSSDAAYVFDFYCLKAGAKTVSVDKTYTTTVAQFGGNANYDEAKISTVINGDKYKVNDLKDINAEYTVVVNAKNVKPYTSAVNSATGIKTYYMGGTGLGSGAKDYLQLKLSTTGLANLNMSLRMRASNTAAGAFQLQYSTDGENFENFINGTAHVAYTQYNSDGSTTDIVKDEVITDGIAKTSLAPAKYVEFTFEIPEGAANADELLIRFVPNNVSANGKSTPSTSGVTRLDSVKITANPIVDSSITGFVKADPEAGAVAVGQELSLSSTTEAAKIYYSVNGGEFALYDNANKPVLTELPTYVEAYAAKEGLEDSIKTSFIYEQAQCEVVKATPNGGAVMAGSRVNLKTNTEGATILYRFVDANENGGVTEEGEWKEFTSSIMLSSLPCKLQAKAVKAGYVDSAVVTLSFTEKANEKYNIYFGQIHAHTNYSDGAGSCEEAFAHASTVANLDYIAITDHSNSLDNAASSVISKNVDTKETDEWTAGHELAKKYTTDDFTSVYGYEMTWSNGLGHMNTFNTPGFQSRTQSDYSSYSTALQNYYKALNTVPDSVSQFNHPGTTFGDFSDFAYYTEENDALITMIEVGNGEGTIGSSGYFPSYEYYTRALDKGWHVAPTNNQDNHKGKWGDANTARTVMLSDVNNEESIYDAMRNYRIYATEDNNLSIYYTLDGYVMGTILEKDMVGDTVNLKVELNDADASEALGKVEVIVNGGRVAASKKVDTNAETVEFEVPSSSSYYYIKVTEADGDIAVTAPIWVGEVEACGINKTYTNTTLAVKGEALDVNVELYNNEKKDLVIDSIDVVLSDVDGVKTEVVSGATMSAVAPNSTGTYTTDFTYNSVGKVTYEVTVNATLDGVVKKYTDKLSVDYVTPEMVSNVIVDGTHFNDYVTGYYGGNVTNFVSLGASENARVTVKTDTITAEDLADCKLLVVSAPAKKTGTANAGDYTPAHFEDEFIELVKNYIANGGSVIVCGLADYSDTANGQTATEQNKLLSAIGSTIRMNSDEVYDEVNNGGQAYRMYPTNFNMDSKYLAGIVEGQTYSQYSGCSVNVDEAVENEVVFAGESLVKGFDTTYSIDCKDENGASAGNKAFDNKGNITFLAHQSTKAGGEIFVAGGVFISDFEVKAEIDNPDDKPYANYNIILNILNDTKAQLPISTIAQARAGEMNQVFAVEGYVTSGTENEATTFFDTIYLQDDTAGIDIFPYAEAGLAVGTKMRVVGYVSEYQGDKELKVISTEILDEDPVVYEAKEVSTKDAMDYDALGGSLLKTKGEVTRVEYNSDGTVAEFWVNDGTGEAAIFIDGYITSATTGVNNLAEFVTEGAYVAATGILYMHPEGDSDVSVAVFRVRSCDDIVLTEKPEVDPEDPDCPDDDDDDISETIEKVVEVITTIIETIIDIFKGIWGKIIGRP